MKNKQLNCLIGIDLTHLDWKKNYTIRCRIGLRIFSFIFPSVLKINFIDEKQNNKSA